MARWTEMSYNRHYSRSNEINKEVFEEEYVENVFNYDECMYGTIENVSIKDCYAVEDVYNDLDMWN